MLDQLPAWNMMMLLYVLQIVRLTAFKSFEISLRFFIKVLSIALNICDVRATHLLEVVLVSAFAILIR